MQEDVSPSLEVRHEHGYEKAGIELLNGMELYDWPDIENVRDVGVQCKRRLARLRHVEGSCLRKLEEKLFSARRVNVIHLNFQLQERPKVGRCESELSPLPAYALRFIVSSELCASDFDSHSGPQGPYGRPAAYYT